MELETGSGIDHANRALGGMLARAMWTSALRAGKVDKDIPDTTAGEDTRAHITLPDVLRDDFGRHKLSLNFSYMPQMNADTIASLGRGLPPNLRELDLRFS